VALSSGNEIRGIALCAGVGGLELGLAIAEPSYRTVCYVEREAYAAAALVARMGDKTLCDAPVWDDVTSFDGRPWRGRVHLVSGGYPCQPFSFCGKRAGESDARHLWPHFARIIGEVRPQRCFFENVEGHVNLGSSRVFSDLAGLGYRVKAGLFSALETGASQIRRRLYIMADADDLALHQPDRDGAVTGRFQAARRSRPEGQTDRARQGGAAVDAALAADAGVRGKADAAFQLAAFPPAPHQFERWAQVLAARPDLQPELFGLDDGLAHWVERSHAAGNGVVPLAAAYAWRTLKAAFDRG
jgi:DNA (cytosine-5)-methyltransferase 1